MKKACVSFSVFTAVCFAILAVWGVLTRGDMETFGVFGTYIIAPFLSLLCCALFSAAYRFYGLISAAVLFVLSLALQFLAFKGTDTVAFIVGTAAILAGVGLGLLLSGKKDVPCAAYHMLTAFFTAFMTAAGLFLQYALFVLFVLFFALDGGENAGQRALAALPYIIVSAVVVSAVSLLATALVRRAFKGAVQGTRRGLLHAALWPLLASLAEAAVLMTLFLIQ